MKTLLKYLIFYFLSTPIYASEINMEKCTELYQAWIFNKSIEEVCIINGLVSSKIGVTNKVGCENILSGAIREKLDKEVLYDLKRNYKKLGDKNFCEKHKKNYELLESEIINDSFLEQTLKYSREGEAKAQILLGKMYLVGNGIKKDTNKAIFWLENSAKQGVIEAKVLLAKIYSESEKTREKCYKNYLSLGDISHEEKKYIKAIEYYKESQRCSQSNKQKIISLASMSTSEYMVGNTKEAKVSLNKILKLSPNNKWVNDFIKKHDIKNSIEKKISRSTFTIELTCKKNDYLEIIKANFSSDMKYGQILYRVEKSIETINFHVRKEHNAEKIHTIEYEASQKNVSVLLADSTKVAHSYMLSIFINDISIGGTICLNTEKKEEFLQSLEPDLLAKIYVKNLVKHLPQRIDHLTVITNALSLDKKIIIFKKIIPLEGKTELVDYVLTLNEIESNLESYSENIKITNINSACTDKGSLYLLNKGVAFNIKWQDKDGKNLFEYGFSKSSCKNIE